jgi:hypothetical protein
MHTQGADDVLINKLVPEDEMEDSEGEMCSTLGDTMVTLCNTLLIPKRLLCTTEADNTTNSTNITNATNTTRTTYTTNTTNITKSYEYQVHVDAFASKGLRTLCFAQRAVSAEVTTLLTLLTLMTLMTLMTLLKC